MKVHDIRMAFCKGADVIPDEYLQDLIDRGLTMAQVCDHLSARHDATSRARYFSVSRVTGIDAMRESVNEQ